MANYVIDSILSKIQKDGLRIRFSDMMKIRGNEVNLDVTYPGTTIAQKHINIS